MIVISTDVVVVCVGAKRFCQCHKIFVTATEYFFFCVKVLMTYVDCINVS